MRKDDNTIIKLFEGKRIRSVWDEEREDYLFSVVDVISVLTESFNPNDYWYRLKIRLKKEEKSELSTNCRQLKLMANDGKYYSTDVLDTKGILRLIESVPSKNAEPFKLWLASLGKERIDEVFNPELAINRAISYYKKRGYSDDWIESRIKGILNRNKLTDAWKNHGINKSIDFAVLTNEIYTTWSGMKASEYKTYKGLRKESLRDNMTDLELLLTDIGEVTTRELVNVKNPEGLLENKLIAEKGGKIANDTRENIEKILGKKIITEENKLSYKYSEENNNILKINIQNKE